MDRNIKKQILSNLCFTLCFSILFGLFCGIAVMLCEQTRNYTDNREAANELKSKLIILDAGHGGEDGGTIGVNGVYEKTLNLDMSEALGTYLKFAGFEVVQTRTEDILLYDRKVDFKGKKKMLDLAARYKIAEELMPDLFVSIHMNAFPDGRYSGLTVYYSPNNGSSYDAAEKIRADVIEKIQHDNKRELKKAGSNIYILNRLHCPSVLVECGFLSNKEECAKLSTEEYRHKLSLVLFSSISSFFNE